MVPCIVSEFIWFHLPRFIFRSLSNQKCYIWAGAFPFQLCSCSDVFTWPFVGLLIVCTTIPFHSTNVIRLSQPYRYFTGIFLMRYILSPPSSELKPTMLCIPGRNTLISFVFIPVYGVPFEKFLHKDCYLYIIPLIGSFSDPYNLSFQFDDRQFCNWESLGPCFFRSNSKHELSQSCFSLIHSNFRLTR